MRRTPAAAVAVLDVAVVGPPVVVAAAGRGRARAWYGDDAGGGADRHVACRRRSSASVLPTHCTVARRAAAVVRERLDRVLAVAEPELQRVVAAEHVGQEVGAVGLQLPSVGRVVW